MTNTQKTKRIGFCANTDQLFIDTTASRKFKHRIGRGGRRRSQARLVCPQHVGGQQKKSPAL